MVVRVDQQIDRTRRPLLDPVDARLGSRSILAVNDDNAVSVDEPPDRAALAVEDAHAARRSSNDVVSCPCRPNSGTSLSAAAITAAVDVARN